MPPALYPRLLGSAWNDVAPAVRRLHVETGPVRASGSFRIRRGGFWRTRMLLRLMRAPHAGDSIATRLSITEYGAGERWHRTFDSRPMASSQWELPGRLLAERFGVLELRFRMEVVDGAILYHQVGSALRVGWFAVRLPRALAPHVEAREGPAGLDRTDVCVRVNSPLFGFVMSYEGTLVCGEAA